MLECRGGRIYTGIAEDVDVRFKAHQEGRGSKFTKMNPPIRILAKKKYHSRSEARQAEIALKKMPYERKVMFMLAHGWDGNGANP